LYLLGGNQLTTSLSFVVMTGRPPTPFERAALRPTTFCPSCEAANETPAPVEGAGVVEEAIGRCRLMSELRVWRDGRFSDDGNVREAEM